MSFHCGMGHASNISLCPALARLKGEHPSLRAQMEDFYNTALEVGADEKVENWAASLNGLLEQATAFVNELDPHSLREEGVLFPMMAKYIGRETGPIAVMEYEHDQAKMNLKEFTTKMGQIGDTVSNDAAKEIASYLINAYTILNEHFMKEENVLFPMAEQMLSADEKEELAKRIDEI